MVSFGLSGEPVRGKTLLSPEPRALRVPYENSAPASNQRLALNFVAYAYATKFRLADRGPSAVSRHYTLFNHTACKKYLELAPISFLTACASWAACGVSE